jgi:hypothetical protein
VTHGHMSGGLSPFPRTGGFLAATASLVGTPAVHHLGRTGRRRPKAMVASRGQIVAAPGSCRIRRGTARAVPAVDVCMS